MARFKTMMPQTNLISPQGVLDSLTEGTCGSLASHMGLVGSKSARETVLSVDTFNTMSRVDVLDHGDHVASSTALAGNNGAVRQEVLPDL